ncbi:monooxygenase [Vanrija albida]|uniref:Monooxygenase n=1 Tax=Vanrija albida TaxID=181172 RepID=A0ABR3Q1K6_9TREE
MRHSPAIPLPPLTRVAIVGAGGPSGLVAVQQLLEAGIPPHKILAYEGRATAGGVWNYAEHPGDIHIQWRKNGTPLLRTDKELDAEGSNGPSAVYDRLRTNLPNKVMAFHNYPFPEDTPIFPWHYQVKHYLQDYAAKKGLNDIIQYQHRVLAVYHTPGTSDPAEKWTVVTENTITRQRRSELVSHIIVSNGHYNEPYIPRVRGLDSFTGEVFHSRWWRNPFQYEGKNVLVVGSKSSGSDIARELAVVDHEKRLKGEKVTRKIYQSLHGLVDPKNPTWDDDLEWAKEINVVAQIDRIDGGIIHLIDGSEVTGVDVIFYATGYLFSYPFCHEQPPFNSQPVTAALSPAEKDKGIPKAGGHTITNLDPSETFYAPDPTLALINLHYLVNPFPLGEITARLVAYSFAHAEVPPLPALRKQSSEPGDIRIGYPQEYINMDNWLLAIGEGGETGGPNHGWKRIPDEIREARRDALKTRKEVLGY